MDPSTSKNVHWDHNDGNIVVVCVTWFLLKSKVVKVNLYKILNYGTSIKLKFQFLFNSTNLN